MIQQTEQKGSTRDVLVIKRVFEAPRELVWKAWTEPEHIMKWWGPKNWTSPVAKIDLRVGGKYHAAMKGPDGQVIWSGGVFREIDRPRRLVMTDSFADEKGNIVHASHYGMNADWLMELLISLYFEEKGGKTTMTLMHSRLKNVPEKDRNDMEQGWNEHIHMKWQTSRCSCSSKLSLLCKFRYIAAVGIHDPDFIAVTQVPIEGNLLTIW